tara:strand:+ start:182 stop:658 length:477 start_codon:yes stop_codon:yes gene_type:complete
MSEAYDIYHLKYEVLLRLSKDTKTQVPEHLVDKYQQISNSFRRLINKRDIRRAARENDPRLLKESWKEIGNAAKDLLCNNWYTHVAKITCDSAVEAARLSTSINMQWFLNGARNIDVNEPTDRSTAHLDIIRVRERHYLYVLGGFYSIEDSKFVGVRE